MSALSKQNIRVNVPSTFTIGISTQADIMHNAAERLLGLAGVEQWMEVWEKVTRLIAQADGINLDRKQVVLGAFHAMERAARA